MPASSKGATKNLLPITYQENQAHRRMGSISNIQTNHRVSLQLIPIFEEIKKMLTPYEKGTMKLLGGSDGKVALVSKNLLKFLAVKEMNFGLLLR